MKLNLLPATVSRGAQVKTAVAISVVIAVLGFVGAILATITSQGALKVARDQYQEAQLPAAQAVAKAQEANALMQQPAVANLVTNIGLADSMMKHNNDYPALYNSLKPYIPPYFRLTHLSAVPLSDTQCTVTMVGTLDTYQQYADLMLSLLTNKQAVSATRNGFTNDEMFVPQLVSTDQQGKPRTPTQQPIPDNSLERLAYFQAQQMPADYQNVGNFGSGTDTTKFAMPGESLVTVEVVLNRNIQTPNPQASLTGAGGTTGGFGGGGFGGGGTFGGPPRGGPGGPPSMPGAPSGGAPRPGAPSAPSSGGAPGRPAGGAD